MVAMPCDAPVRRSANGSGDELDDMVWPTMSEDAKWRGSASAEHTARIDFVMVIQCSQSSDTHSRDCDVPVGFSRQTSTQPGELHCCSRR